MGNIIVLKCNFQHTTCYTREFCVLINLLHTCREMLTLPSKTGFEVTVHFLFNRLDPTRCHEHFRFVSSNIS